MRFGAWMLVVAALAAARSGAQSRDVLLEQAIYAEETAGDVEAAIRLYRQIVAAADADRAVTAQALYRLGLCLDRRGRKDEAHEAFTRLVREFSDQADLASRVRARLAPKLLAAPWSEGEALWIATRSVDSERTHVHDVHLASRGEGGTWILRRYHVSAHRSDTHASVSRVEADADTFLPVRSSQRGRAPSATYDIRYAGGRAEVTSQGTTTSVPLKGSAYDRSQLHALLRRLPLAAGFSTSVAVFSANAGLVEARIRVDGKEAVTVPAGTFDCYKVMVSIGPVHTSEEPHWISADTHRYLVKEGTSLLHELAKIERWDPSTAAAFADERWGIALTPPAGWVSNRPAPRDTDLSVTVGVVSPDGAVACSADFQGEGGGYTWRRDWLPRDAAQRGLQLKTITRPTHAVREASWSDAPVAGLPTVRYTADYRDAQAERDMTEYVAYVRAQATFVEITCRTAKDEFETRKAEMEALMEGVRIP